MTSRSFWRRTSVHAAASVALCVPMASAQERAAGPAPDVADARVERLESLVEKQQREIANLNSRLALGDDAQTDAARTAALKAEIRAILSDREFRESLIPATMTAGYDNGFYIRSSDDKFRIVFNGLLQFRWTYYETQSRNRYLLPRLERDDRTGFDLNRVRVTLSGNAVSPDLTYYLQIGADASGRYDAGLYYAWTNYRFADEFQLKAGIFDLATTRNTMNDDAAQHFVDRPVFDAVFGLGTGLGMRLWGQLFNKRLEYYLDVVNSTSDGENASLGRTISNDPAELDNNPAVIARLNWHILGPSIPNDFTSESDLEFHNQPAWDVGIHYAFNEDRGDIPTTRQPFPLAGGRGLGGFGLTTTNGLQVNQFGVDTAFKLGGFSLLGEYAVRVIDPRHAFGSKPFTPLALLTGEQSTVAQQGAILSLGYFLPIPGLEKKLEVVGRVGGLSTLGEGQEGTWEYGVGLNYYIQGQNVKLQADLTKIYEAPITSSYSSLANVNDDALVFRVQLQVAF